MAVDWDTLRPKGDRFIVQDINGEDWYDVEDHFGLKPGEYIKQLLMEKQDLSMKLKHVKQALQGDPAVRALAILG